MLSHPWLLREYIMRYLVILVVVAVLCSQNLLAHSGRTDSRGGHHDRIHGGYHFHNSGYAPRTTLYTPRSFYRSTSKTSYRNSARVTTKKSRRKPRLRTPTYANALYIEFEIEDFEKSTDPCCFKLFEISSKKSVETKSSLQFGVVDDFSSFASLKNSSSDAESEIQQLIGQASLLKHEARFYLNGMSRGKTSWARSRIEGNKYCIWVRNVASHEFYVEGKWGLKHEFRTWSDNLGKYEVNAALIRKDSNHVSLLLPTGRKIIVEISRLSEKDKNFLRSKF